MPNPLTGDFEAVLEVSGGTINRLLASMHQNAFTNRDLPSFPHSLRIRIGDDYAFEGVRGAVQVQISAPRVELIHGATDRFILEVGVRAWYRPDPGTEPLPAYIHGTVRAEYRIQSIDPSCPGWAKKAADFLWIRVARDSVRFQGTAEDDFSILEVSAASPADPAANLAKVTRQIARQLAKRFEASPQKISKGFGPGSLRSLNAPIGGSAVALPLGLSGGPWGQIHTIHNVLLNGADLSLAVDIGYILAQVNAALAPIAAFSGSFPVDEMGISTVYHFGLHPPSVQWLPQGSFGVFKIRVNGWANTESMLPNATISVEQDVILNFGERLWLSPGSLTINPHIGGVGGLIAKAIPSIKARIKAEAGAKIRPVVESVCKSAQGSLDKMTPTGGLLDQLKKLDDQAAVWLDSAEFAPDGIVVRGTIDVAPRRPPVVKQEKMPAGDAHSALESWIPGGRIDRLEWSWTWSGSGTPGARTHHDRFLLHRPWTNKSRWGMAAGGKSPIPGLDGSGRVCLRITGVRVHPISGEFETVISTSRCARFGFLGASELFGPGRLFLRDMPELSKDVPFPQLKDVPLVAARRGGDPAGAANTLLVYAGERWDGETAATLREGLEACRRYDAGLAVLVLFREGVLDGAGPQVISEIEELGRVIGIAVHVNEDVGGGWSRALELGAAAGEPAWALITPQAHRAWKHSGRIEPRGLAAALDIHLQRSSDFKPALYRPALEIGSAIAATVLHPGIGDLADLAEPRCPPLPLNRWGSEALVTFVQRASGATAAHLRKLAGRYGKQGREGSPEIFVVVDGADSGAAEALKRELGLDFPVIPDPEGKLTDGFGVGLWPTTITLDSSGIVSDVEDGIAGDREPECLCPEG